MPIHAPLAAYAFESSFQVRNSKTPPHPPSLTMLFAPESIAQPFLIGEPPRPDPPPRPLYQTKPIPGTYDEYCRSLRPTVPPLAVLLPLATFLPRFAPCPSSLSPLRPLHRVAPRRDGQIRTRGFSLPGLLSPHKDSAS